MAYVPRVDDQYACSTDSYDRTQQAYQPPEPSYSPPFSQYPDHKQAQEHVQQYNVMYDYQHPSERQVLPEVGQTRCYWTLLSETLQFLVIDPVLDYHLREQAPLIFNTNLLDYIHPDEKEAAQLDLGRVLHDRELHGSVTRVRFCRLSIVRRILGHEPSEGSPPYPPSFPANRISIDSTYMAVDIVINYVADGLVLCFLHAVVDLVPDEDNDESNRTGWSNWCSTYGFDEDYSQQTVSRLINYTNAIRSAPRSHSDPSLRVLHVLSNSPYRSIIFSWPPEPYSDDQGQGFTVTSEQLLRISQNVQLTGNTSSTSEAKTSCTRRFKSSQELSIPLPEGQSISTVDSIYIPHGTVIFACHKIDIPYYDGSQQQTDVFHEPHDINSALYAYNTQMPPEYVHSGDPSDGRVYVQNEPDPPAPQVYHGWAEQPSQVIANADVHVQNVYSSPYHSGHNIETEHPYSAPHPHESWSEPSTSYAGSSLYSSERLAAASTDSLNVVKPERPLTPLLKFSPKSERSSPAAPDRSPQPKRATGSTRETVRDSYGGSGRSSGNPPSGVEGCASCKTTHSPEWRKGPSGKKDLCNACGLRFARSRAKKEGAITKKKKDKLGLSPSMRSSSLTPSTIKSGYSSEVGTLPTQSFVRSQLRDDSNDSYSRGTSSASSSPPDSLVHAARSADGSLRASSSLHGYPDSSTTYSIHMSVDVSSDDHLAQRSKQASFALSHAVHGLHAPIPSMPVVHQQLAYLSGEHRRTSASPALSSGD